jgi:hypothetical protein
MWRVEVTSSRYDHAVLGIFWHRDEEQARSHAAEFEHHGFGAKVVAPE